MALWPVARFGARIRSISKAAGGGWDVTAFGDSASAHFDGVVFGGSVAEVCQTDSHYFRAGSRAWRTLYRFIR